MHVSFLYKRHVLTADVPNAGVSERYLAEIFTAGRRALTVCFPASPLFAPSPSIVCNAKRCLILDVIDVCSRCRSCCAWRLRQDASYSQYLFSPFSKQDWFEFFFACFSLAVATSTKENLPQQNRVCSSKLCHSPPFPFCYRVMTFDHLHGMDFSSTVEMFT